MLSVTTGNPLASIGDAAGTVGGALAVSLLGVLVQLVLLAAVYVWTSLALAAVFRKAGLPSGRAWVPVLNIWMLFELAGMKGWWAAVIVGGGLLTAVIASVAGSLLLQSAQEAAFGGGGDGAGAILAASVVPTLLFLVFLAGVVILLVRMMGPLNRGFGRGGGFVALGALLLPVWASVIGWGAARWQGLPQKGLPPTPFAAEPVAVDTRGVPADTSGFAPPAPAPTSAPGPGTPAAASVPVHPWSPPPLAPVAAPVPAPAAPAAPPAAPAVAPGEQTELEEHTVLAAHRRPAASLRLPTGQTVALTSDTIVLGRNPAPPSDAPEAQPIAIDDTTRTVSKTHALLRRTGDAWTITDLASTNGVVVGTSDTEITVGTPVPLAGRFLLGDAELTLDAGSR